MGVAMTCDSCGAEVEPNDHARLSLPSDGTEAGASLDLCRACVAGVAQNAKIKAAVGKFRQRRDAALAATTHAPPGPVPAVPPT